MQVRTLRGNTAVVTETYEEHKHVVEGAARRFARRFCRDAEEAIADANLTFCEAYHTHDPARSELGQRLNYLIPRELYEPIRLEGERNARLPRAELSPAVAAPAAPAPFDAEEWAADNDVGDDSLAVIRLLLESPAELADALRPEMPPGEVRRCLCRYLIDTLGWARARVTETFREIAEALS